MLNVLPDNGVTLSLHCLFYQTIGWPLIMYVVYVTGQCDLNNLCCVTRHVTSVIFVVLPDIVTFLR
jgi:hypothetical protein